MRRVVLPAVLLLFGCKDAEAWRPGRAPIELAITSEAVSDAQVDAVLDAVARWHAALGTEVVRVRIAPGAAPRCDRVDLAFAPMRGLANGTTLRRTCSASITLHDGLSPSYMRVVAAHELGHALGLDHDAEPHSLMRASAPRDGGVITQAARAYVRDLLGD